MKKNLLSLGLLIFGVSFAANAQYPLKTIQEVQTVSPQDLAAGNDASPIGATDTIRIRGVVVMDAGLSTLIQGKQIWIQTNDGSAFSGIDIYQPTPSTPGDDGGTGILSLVAGDSVEITGRVEEFSGETEFIPIVTNPATPIQLLGSGITVKSKLITAGELNDNNRQNILTTGEQYEGQYVELRNMTVVTVDPFSNGARVSFNIADASGNRVNVSDRFLAMRLPATGGTFVAPNIGDFITSIKGVIIHSKNNRGYEIHPFDRADLVYGASAPTITALAKNVAVPNNNDAVTISANITDADGIKFAKLYYAVGTSNQNYISIPMVANGNSYSATIPAQADASFIKYFIEARDNSADSLLSRIPNVPTEDPKFYVVRNNGLTVFDLQYTPFRGGNSGYVDQSVTVSGVVTASVSDLGYVYIQQENQSTFAGIPVVGGTGLDQLATGDKVTITGTVKEYFGLTRLESVTNIQKSGTGTITPVTLEPDSFRIYTTTYGEAYESMLIKFATTTGKGVYITNTNADAPSNFAEYRVGRDTSDAGAGSRVMAGRQTSTAFSSKNVSYVNDSAWAPNTGLPILVVEKGDTMVSITGIMTYSFSNMKLLPRNNNDFEGYSRQLVGINSNTYNKGEVIVYPNPTSSNFNLKYNMPKSSENITVSVYDVLGNLVVSKSLSSTEGNAKIETSNLTNGTYIYVIQSENDGILNTGRVVVLK
jgi:predicted extracellular nuclease